jgi:uncharacterized protein YggE
MWVMATACVPPALAAERAPIERTVTVTGTGTAQAAPDRAEIVAGVHSQADTASAALAANNEAANRLFKTLAELGIADRDRQTRNVNVGPVYEQPHPQRGGAPRIVGYQVTNQVRVVVRDLAKLGQLLDAVVKSGANRLDGIRFIVSDPAAATDQARRAAIEDAKRRAALYVETAGARLGRVLQISEAAVHVPRPVMMRAEAMAAAADVPVAPGENEITATVSVVFAVE